MNRLDFRQPVAVVKGPRLAFTKMHGLGNDFMVIDNQDESVTLDAARIRRLSDRHTGVGFDQLLVVQASSTTDAEFDYRIFNADGQEVEHCGNGARCFARFVHERGLSSSREIPVNTCSGRIVLRLLESGEVSVMMGVPEFTPAAIPFLADQETPRYLINLGDEELKTGCVAIGNPHVVLDVASVERAEVARLGPLLEAHERFPRKVNVGFSQRLAPDHIRLRVFERGVGETRACGSGACAAVVIGQRQGLLARSVRVSLTGGDLQIHWPHDQAPVEMIGPCSTVFEGQTTL